jgi:hypothetical protein
MGRIALGDKFKEIVRFCNNYDFDRDGVPEIESMQLLEFEPLKDIDSKKKLLLVLVEPRLFEDIPNSLYSPDDLINRLEIYRHDLSSEGFDARFLRVKVYSGYMHQDGKTLLALREFFRQIRKAYRNFVGAILVGAFPEAMIVRSWLRPETFGYDVTDDSGRVVRFPDDKKKYIVGLGIHALRSEIVLADLNGNWENLYYQNPNTIPSRVIIPETEQQVSSNYTKVTSSGSNYVLTHAEYQDFFWIKDDDWWISPSYQGKDSSVVVLLNSGQIDENRSAGSQLDPELSTVDKGCINPIARPEIIVSRINAKNIAASPDNRLVGQDGKPQQASTALSISTNIFDWNPDPALERTLLIDYFDRNHEFRKGTYQNQTPTDSIIEYNVGTAMVLQGLDGINLPRDEVTNASLLDFVKWMKKPITIRGISAHTSGRSACMTEFKDDENYDMINTETGGHPWRWIEQAGQYVPSFMGHFTADLNLYRTMWENKVLRGIIPSFFLHIGCDVNSPDGGETKPYNASGYGACNSAEGLLFYLNGLAAISRSKMFNDGPTGFGEGFGRLATSTFGDGWQEHFTAESNDGNLARQPTERKKSSFWSVIGDWTLRKYY